MLSPLQQRLLTLMMLAQHLENKKDIVMKKLILIALIAGFSQASFAESEVLLTSSNAKSNINVTTIDLINDGNVSAFQFEVPIQKGIEVDLSNCLSDLPDTHQGICTINDEKTIVRVAAYSTSSALFSSQVVSVGKIGTSQPYNLSASNIKLLDKTGDLLNTSNEVKSVQDGNVSHGELNTSDK